MHKFLFILFMILFDTVASGSITVTNTFSANTLIVAAQVNANFVDVLAGINNIGADQIDAEIIGKAKLNDDIVVDGILTFSQASGLDFGQSGDIILSTAASAPTGWTDVSETYADKFIRISASALSTGGSDNHYHTVGSLAVSAHDHAFSATTSSNSSSDSGGSSGVVADSPHTHTVSGTTELGGQIAVHGQMANADNIPAYVTLKMFQKD